MKSRTPFRLMVTRLSDPRGFGFVLGGLANTLATSSSFLPS